MFSIFYDIALFVVGLVALPKLLWQYLVVRKYRASLGERLGLKLPPELDKTKGPIIWIHAVSVGETRAVIPLYQRIRTELPSAQIVISSVTETGHAEAKRALPGAASYFFLPLDFSWLMKRVVQRIKPDLLILVEGEFWYQLLRHVKKAHGKIALVNGRLSERSYKRFKMLPWFAKQLFAPIDLFCLQSERYLKRFSQLKIPQEKLVVTGNLKLDATPKLLEASEKAALEQELGITSQDRVLVIASTHEPEEDELLTALKSVWQKFPMLKVLLAPRHPERFSKVLALIQTHGLSAITYTDRAHKRGDERVVLIDTMGQLMRCFQLAEIAIVGGSFTPHVGGHNIFEPVQVDTPVLFGPHMQAQSDLADLVLQSNSGYQVSILNLPTLLIDLLSNPQTLNQMRAHCSQVATQARGATSRTWSSLKNTI